MTPLGLATRRQSVWDQAAAEEAARGHTTKQKGAQVAVEVEREQARAEQHRKYLTRSDPILVLGPADSTRFAVGSYIVDWAEI